MQVVSYEACALLKYISGIGSNPRCPISFFYTFLLLLFWNLLHCLFYIFWIPLSPSSPAPVLHQHDLLYFLSAEPSNKPSDIQCSKCAFIFLHIYFAGVTDEVHCILVAQWSWPNHKVTIQKAVWMSKRSVCCTGTEDFFLPFFFCQCNLTHQWKEQEDQASTCISMPPFIFKLTRTLCCSPSPPVSCESEGALVCTKASVNGTHSAIVRLFIRFLLNYPNALDRQWRQPWPVLYIASQGASLLRRIIYIMFSVTNIAFVRTYVFYLLYGK